MILGIQSKALVVDDNESMRFFFKSILKAPRYWVVEAENGEAAVDLVGSQAFDLAFIDINMPGINGIQTSRKLREIQPRLKTVLMSGLLNPHLGNAVLEADACEFIPKPVLPATIRALAVKLLFHDQVCRQG